MDEFADFVDNLKVCIVGLFAEEGGAAHNMFNAIADADVSLPYGVSFDHGVRHRLVG